MFPTKPRRSASSPAHESLRAHGRRHALGVAGAAAVSLLVPRAFAQRSEDASRACVLTPAQTEGPYFVDERLERSDIRGDPGGGSLRPGTPLALELRVVAVAGSRCAPLAGAIVDVWHCDAAGAYSDVDDPRFATRGARFLRGYQKTDAEGRVRFETIYPGAYPGRAVHVHFKVRATLDGRGRELTSQLYFDDALTDRVHAREPYPGGRRTRNGQDGLFRQGGAALVLAAEPSGDGYAAAHTIGVRAA